MEAMEGKRKPWKRSRSRGRGSEVVEEDWKSWKRAEEAGQGLEVTVCYTYPALVSSI